MPNSNITYNGSTNMTHKEVEEYLLSMSNSYLDYPFGEGVAVYKVRSVPDADEIVESPNLPKLSTSHFSDGDVVTTSSPEKMSSESILPTSGGPKISSESGKGKDGDGKMFALIAEGSEPLRLSLKCDPGLAEVLREKYETVLPGYHLNKKHWNTLILSGQLEEDEVKDLIRHSYNLVCDS